MLKAAARLLLLRVLPRRILPIVTVVEALLFVRSIWNRSRTKVNPPTASRTAPPRTVSPEAGPPSGGTTPGGTTVERPRPTGT
jgi:hypothetical protein